MAHFLQLPAALSMALPLVIVLRGFKPCHRYIMRKTGESVAINWQEELPETEEIT